MADVWLQRPSEDVPWGFRLQGGRDTGEPLTVARVSPGSVASKGLKVADVILRIGDCPTNALTQQQAQEVIKSSGNMLKIQIASKTGYQGGVSQKVPAPVAVTGLHDVYEDTYNGRSGALSRSLPSSSAGGSYQSYQPEPLSGRTHHYSNQLNDQLYQMNVNDDELDSSPFGLSYGFPSRGRASPADLDRQAMPDAVINMASKQGQGKKPFSYTPDLTSIQEHKDKVRKRQTQPRYQQMLNLPSFDDKPVKLGLKMPPQQQQQHNLDDREFTAAMAEKYNSPMNLYSTEEVQNALIAQSEGRITGAPQEQKDITESPVYKMVHGIDQRKPRTPVLPKDVYAIRGPREPSSDDELRFSGLHSTGSSRGNKLQRAPSTGGSEIDETSIRPNFGPVDSTDGGENIGQYDAASIRYRGNNIPSKSFRLLQNMTGGAQENPPPRPASAGRPTGMKARKKAPEPQQPPEQNADPDDIVDIRFVGGNIPSRSFRMLQSFVGEEQQVPHAPDLGDSQGRTVKVTQLRSKQQNRGGVSDF